MQGANDINAEDDRVAIKNEIDQLGVELDRIATTTNFNGKYVLSGQYQDPDDPNGTNTFAENISEEIDPDTNGWLGALNIQAGANATLSDVIQIAFKGVTATDLLGEAGLSDATWINTNAIDDYASRINPGEADKGFLSTVTSQESGVFDNAAMGVSDEDTKENFTSGFQSLINVIDGKMANGEKIEDGPKTGIALVSDLRSQLGAVQNRLEHTIANLDTVSENMQAAESRIRDVDMAKEMMKFTTSNVLNQAATAMLAQANQAPQTVLSLLRS